ncbi:MAG: DNA-binding transcriptional LysR family regulator [Gammaproteobacteria bacterium]|jgi:DNA-binding transcriptional LysR family regulator
MSNLDTQLKTFLQVAQLGSFRRAAEELFVTQAAVTSRIKMLEEWLGYEVFLRHRRGADLTIQGERFIDYARNALDTLEHGREDARHARSYRVQYRFMSQYLLLEGIAFDWIDWMKQKIPDVSISIDCSHSKEAANEVSSGLLDIAIGYQYRNTKGVVFEKLFDERLILVTSWPDQKDWRNNYIPIGWDAEFDDDQRRFIGELEEGNRLRAFFIDSARALILREPGSAYIIERSAAPLIKQGHLRRVDNAPVFERPAHAIYPVNPAQPDIQEMALRGLREISATYR